MFCLFLDDLRDPPDWNVWLVARSVLEAVALIEHHGYPDVVSFDHDLGSEFSGMDFAKWLVERDLEKGDMPTGFRYHVHSANPVGRQNIEGLLDGYLNFKKLEANGNPQTDNEGPPAL